MVIRWGMVGVCGVHGNRYSAFSVTVYCYVKRIKKYAIIIYNLFKNICIIESHPIILLMIMDVSQEG